jgi:hypothetical protein
VDYSRDALVPLQVATMQVTYSDFKKKKTLNEGSKFYELTYGVDEDRRESV